MELKFLIDHIVVAGFLFLCSRYFLLLAKHIPERDQLINSMDKQQLTGLLPSVLLSYPKWLLKTFSILYLSASFMNILVIIIGITMLLGSFIEKYEENFK